MADTDKITDNRNQDFYGFSCTSECKKVSVSEDGFIRYSSCDQTLSLVSFSSSEESFLFVSSLLLWFPRIL